MEKIGTEQRVQDILLQSKCNQLGHEEYNYIMVCLNDQCLYRGEPICPECQFDRHNHQASESFITLQKYYKFMNEGDQQKQELKNSINMLQSNFQKLKKELLVSLDEAESQINKKSEEILKLINSQHIQQSDLDSKNILKLKQYLQGYSKLLEINNKQLQYKNKQSDLFQYEKLIKTNFRDIQNNLKLLTLEADIMESEEISIDVGSVLNLNLDNIKFNMQGNSSIDSKSNFKKKKLQITDSRFQIPSTGSWYYEGNKKCDGIVIQLKKKESVELWGIKTNKIKDWEENQELIFELIVCLGSDLSKRQIYQQEFILEKKNYKLDNTGEFLDLMLNEPIIIDVNKKYAIGLKYDQAFETSQGKKPKECNIFKFTECEGYPDNYADNGTCVQYGIFPKFIYQIPN